MNVKPSFLKLAILLISVLAMNPASASLCTWDGGGANNLWSNATNWVGDVAPQPGDDLLFPPGASQDYSQNDFPVNTILNSIAFSGSSYSISGNTIALNAGIIATNTGAVTINNPLILNSNQTFVIHVGANSISLLGAIDTNGKELAFDVELSTLHVQSAITGTGGLVKTGSGSVLLYASNSFSGPVQVLDGYLSAYHQHALGTTNGGTTIATGGILSFLNQVVSSEPLALGGTLRSSGGGSKTLNGPLTITESNATVVVNIGAPLTINGVISGTGGFTKTSVDTLTLTADNTYTGTTTVNGGTLWVNGSQPASPIMFSGDVLGGTGTLGSVTVTGPYAKTLAPGSSPGLLACGNLVLDSTATFQVELNGLTAGSGYDQLHVNGPVSLGNATLGVSLGFLPAPGTSFIILDNDGTDAINGTFNGLPEGAVLNVGGNKLRISYVGGTGNDVELTLEFSSLLVVSNLNDSGGGSLRQAVADALPNSAISFAPGLAGTISLTNGELVLATNLTILGPGADTLAINGRTANRVFRVDGGLVAISGLTIQNGRVVGESFDGGGGGGGGPGESVRGGGILNAGTLVLNACSLSNNAAIAGNGSPGGDGEGGGIASTGALSLTNCTIWNSQARGGDGSSSGSGGGTGRGGGIYCEGSLQLYGSTIAGNSAVGGTRQGPAPDGQARGGGIRASGVTDLTLCTLSGNQASAASNARGGALEDLAATTIRSCTIVSNSAQHFGGGIEQAATLTIQNSIISLNTANTGPNVDGAVVSQGYNLVGAPVGSGGWTATGDQTGADPQVGALQNNGGLTPTHALLWFSPAMDQGNSAGLATDQRGEPRYDDPGLVNATGGDGSDIGAYEAAELRILDWQIQGADFRLSYPSLAGRNDHILSTTTPGSGNWETNLANVPGSGGILQVTLPNAASSPERYFRVQRVP